MYLKNKWDLTYLLYICTGLNPVAWGALEHESDTWSWRGPLIINGAHISQEQQAARTVKIFNSLFLFIFYSKILGPLEISGPGPWPNWPVREDPGLDKTLDHPCSLSLTSFLEEKKKIFVHDDHHYDIQLSANFQ